MNIKGDERQGKVEIGNVAERLFDEQISTVVRNEVWHKFKNLLFYKLNTNEPRNFGESW